MGGTLALAIALQFAEALSERNVILDGAVMMPPQDPPTQDAPGADGP